MPQYVSLGEITIGTPTTGGSSLYVSRPWDVVQPDWQIRMYQCSPSDDKPVDSRTYTITTKNAVPLDH